jgi:hypothetical protein
MVKLNHENHVMMGILFHEMDVRLVVALKESKDKK